MRMRKKGNWSKFEDIPSTHFWHISSLWSWPLTFGYQKLISSSLILILMTVVWSYRKLPPHASTMATFTILFIFWSTGFILIAGLVLQRKSWRLVAAPFFQFLIRMTSYAQTFNLSICWTLVELCYKLKTINSSLCSVCRGDKPSVSMQHLSCWYTNMVYEAVLDKLSSYLCPLTSQTSTNNIRPHTYLTYLS